MKDGNSKSEEKKPRPISDRPPRSSYEIHDKSAYDFNREVVLFRGSKPGDDMPSYEARDK